MHKVQIRCLKGDLTRMNHSFHGNVSDTVHGALIPLIQSAPHRLAPRCPVIGVYVLISPNKFTFRWTKEELILVMQ